MTPNVGLMLLAAGGSRRLGMPKQLLRDAGGRSLVRRAADAALETVCRPIVAVLGAFAEAVGGELAGLPVTSVINNDWQSGMASSLKAGLAALTADGPPEAIVVMLCDQPMMTAALLDSLVEAHRASRADLVVCEYGGNLGVPALFGPRLFDALASLQGDQGARHVIRAHTGPVARIPFPEGILDVDTSQDVERLALL